MNYFCMFIVTFLLFPVTTDIAAEKIGKESILTNGQGG
jgi:hypothetical protein